ncbi:MAG: 1,4-dihydroxy-2-naphthoate octaprenyltransferase [Bifidobacteriaceae bacterium]|nr:1,4-dihydroxy-2-naphthoate octaprenyltransferase [Bifidobacteriaceae bacterium]
MKIAPFIYGARPKTLTASIAPVLAGSACAWGVISSNIHCNIGGRVSREVLQYACLNNSASFDLIRSCFFHIVVLCLISAVGLQIFANYANDYWDGVYGRDSKRVEPMSVTGKPVRMVASGKVSPRAMLCASIIAACVACVAGLIAVIISRQYWLLIVGVSALLSAWLYSSGNQPYSKYGLGEIVAAIFFGPVAMLGTQYLIVQYLNTSNVMYVHNIMLFSNTFSGDWFMQASYGINIVSLFISVCIACNAVLLMMINNLRDIDDDLQNGKVTLVGHLGKPKSITVFLVVVITEMLLSLCVLLFLLSVMLSTDAFRQAVVFLVWMAQILMLGLIIRNIRNNNYEYAFNLVSMHNVLSIVYIVVALVG